MTARAVITVGGTMGANARVGVRGAHTVGRSTWRTRLLVLGVLAAMVAIPCSAISASAQSGGGSAPVVKVGMITSLTGPLAANPEVKDALLASIAAFNKRGGVGTGRRQAPGRRV